MPQHPEPQKTFQRQYKTLSSLAHLTECVTTAGGLLIYQVTNAPKANIHESSGEKKHVLDIIRPIIFAASFRS